MMEAMNVQTDPQNNEADYSLDLVRIQLVPDRVLFKEETIKSSSGAAEIAMAELAKYDREVFAILNINAKGQVINLNIVSIGDLCSSTTHPREVFKGCVLANAGSAIAFHNHPSGDPTPSEMDIQTTRRLCEAGEILGIPLLDHIIIGNGTKNYISMRACGYMDYDDDLCCVQDQNIAYAALRELEKKEPKEALAEDEAIKGLKKPLQERISEAVEKQELQDPKKRKTKENER